jgi:integrase
MLDMPRARKPYTQREKTRHGKFVWYFRKGDGPRTRLRGEYESQEWLQDYANALAGILPRPKPKSAPQTLAWLVERYMGSAAFYALQPSTQRSRGNILKSACRTGGEMPLADIDRSAIAAGRDRRAKTPFAAVNFMKTMGYLFSWAVDSGLMTENPVKGVARPKAKSQGHKPWVIEDLIRYCEHHPLGTKAHLAVALLLFTGVRRGDVYRIGKQHVRSGVIEFQTEKTKTPIYIPIPPALAASIVEAPTGDMMFLVTEWGTPFKSAASFGNWFAKQCTAAGVDVRAHGLRKLAATVIADNEGSEKMLQAFFGWRSERQSSVYTRNANARKLAQDAARKLLENDLSPHLQITSPHLGLKR